MGTWVLAEPEAVVLQSELRNNLLRKLSEADFEVVAPCLVSVDLVLKQEILHRGNPIDYVYFPEDCVCSVLALTDNVNPIEVGIFGYEGMSDLLLREGQTSALTLLIQVAGSAFRIGAADFVRLFNEQPSFRDMVLRYKEVAAIQFAFTALAHGSFTIEERLARWLLMSFDRSKRETIPMVHEFLAAMLAVRRSGITTATHVLEGAGAIRASRGSITIRDRNKLLEMAGESYGAPEAYYDLLFSY
jgi:CRP-like cAMP-binding protein